MDGKERLARGGLPVTVKDFKPEIPENILQLPKARDPDDAYRRQLKPEEWEALRPVVEQLFIREKKTYREVAAILRDQHDFNPSYVCDLIRVFENTCTELIACVENGNSKPKPDYGD